MFGVTFGDPGLSVAFRVFNSAGTPTTAWVAANNYDGNSYQLPITFGSSGAFSVKKVVFTSGAFTVRDTGYSEAEDAVQVVDPAVAPTTVPTFEITGYVITETIIQGEV